MKRTPRGVLFYVILKAPILFYRNHKAKYQFILRKPIGVGIGIPVSAVGIFAIYHNVLAHR